ncbi:MAG: DPP IV N-terminal domain-containing protein [Bacteroidota bacterium]
MKKGLVLALCVFVIFSLSAQDQSILTLDRIYNSNEFSQQYLPAFQWIEGGDAYVLTEYDEDGKQQLVKYDIETKEKSLLVSADQLMKDQNLVFIESFTLSADQSKLLIFTNSSRVWRANTKGDFWIYDLKKSTLKQVGQSFPASSLMFAKFSNDNSKVAFVHGFNLYVENLETGKIDQLTKDGGEGIINGTFDWAYEEEFGKRDGFNWSPDAKNIAFWKLDASKIGTFYMINNTDSIYSKPIPLQYPKVGQDPSSCQVGIVDMSTQNIKMIPLEGSIVQNYIPGMQWVNEELLLIQQLNRHQNKLIVWSYNVKTEELKKVYTEIEKTWVAIQYPDLTASGWGDNDLILVDGGKAFLRMTEGDGWRHIYKVNIQSGEKTLMTPGSYDVASYAAVTSDYIYFHASPENSTQRYLYKVNAKGGGKAERVSPKSLSGINTYNCAPNGKYAVHSQVTAMSARTINLVSLPQHKTLEVLVDNKDFITKISNLDLPEVEFFKVTTETGIEIDGRMVKPINFDPNKKYPVLFHVYGEPWGQVATDNWIGLWNIYLAQRGYVVIDMDNRGTPCLKGSGWRQSIYRKIGVVNTEDQALAAKEVLKMDFIDSTRTAVWGWSGGGTMTLNLMFKYPDLYKAGMSVAPVSNQLVYNTIYQERYMGLPQENMEDFVVGSPITYAKNLKGELLLVHGTNDDTVHYQSMELLVNELIKHNKQFQMMSYPNRSHGIYEGQNTRRHLYTLLTNYLMSKVPNTVRP